MTLGFYGDRELFAAGAPGSGAVLFMRNAAKSSASYTTKEGWSISASEGERGLVVQGPELYGFEEVLSHAEESSHVALDIFAATGAVTSTLARPSDLCISWWGSEGNRIVRICSSDVIRLDGKAAIMAKGGKAEGGSPAWHPSLRYYRHANTTSDLLDAFRNLYLALESIISEFYPRQDGEAESDWLRISLNKLSEKLNLSKYTYSNSEDLAGAIVKRIYTDIRTATFHAKHGRRVILPYGADGRKSLALTVRQMRSMYADIAQFCLGIRINQGSRFMGGLYGTMINSVVEPAEVYVSPDISSGSEGARKISHKAQRLHRSSGKASKDGFFVAVMAFMEAKEKRTSIQEFGLLLNGEIGLVSEFEVPLKLPGMQPLELSITLRGDEEGSAFPIYVT